MSSSPIPSFKTMWWRSRYHGFNQPPTYYAQYAELRYEDSLGGCCGSAYYTKDSKPRKHFGIVVYPEDVKVEYKLRPSKYTTEKVVTKNGTFNVSLRIAK